LHFALPGKAIAFFVAEDFEDREDIEDVNDCQRRVLDWGAHSAITINADFALTEILLRRFCGEWSLPRESGEKSPPSDKLWASTPKSFAQKISVHPYAEAAEANESLECGNNLPLLPCRRFFSGAFVANDHRQEKAVKNHRTPKSFALGCCSAFRRSFTRFRFRYRPRHRFVPQP